MMKRRYQIRPQAEADLDGFARRIAHDNLDAALRLYDSAEETYRMLGQHPEMGVLYQSAKPTLSGIRFFPIKDFSRYLVFYKPIPDGVGIVRVLHSRMDKESWL